eukprot:GHVT01044470.1.p1 GENE.GHVT01044470.1~~GHVT01044470.1.p1  ORF type:complete len:172 (-),score=22.82 GHVT01044470.1:514-1029(-)
MLGGTPDPNPAGRPSAYDGSAAGQDQELRELLAARKEWARAAIFDADGVVSAATFETNDSQLRSIAALYDNREAAIGEGIFLQDDNFEIHQWSPPLIYGRRGGPTDSEGIALVQGGCRKTGTQLFSVITFKLPTLTARAVPQLVEFFQTHVGDVPRWDTPLPLSDDGLPPY